LIGESFSIDLGWPAGRKNQLSKPSQSYQPLWTRGLFGIG